METSVFKDKNVRPDAELLASALGTNHKHWEVIQNYLSEHWGAVSEEWKFYGPKSGWQLKVLLKKRNLFFLTPLPGRFRVAFIFGDRAVTVIEASDLAAALKKELHDAPRYAEGRGLRVDVLNDTDVKNVYRLLAVKISH
jgi:hypothetical protein